jgi:hypothetical protein
MNEPVDNLRSESPPRLEPGVDFARFCEAWASSPPLRELVAAFGGEMLESMPTADLFVWLEEFSVVWDYRRRRERNEAEVPEFDPAMTRLVDTATRELGLQDKLPPSRSHYDRVLILGGLARGCVARPIHAAALIEGGVITTDRIIALGGFRPLNEAELPLLDQLGFEGGGYEFDAMEFGVRRAFGLDAAIEVSEGGDSSDYSHWRVDRYAGRGRMRIEVAAAPAPDPHRRADTADTYEWLANDRGAVAAGDSILIVTTFHYRLYQLAEAIRMLGIPHGLLVDAVGMVPGEADERLAWMPSTGALLQEVRSSIRSLGRLHAAVTRG